MRRRPDLEKATEVTPQIMLSCEYCAISWSALMSNTLTVASSEPVQNAVPCGKNCCPKAEEWMCATKSFFGFQEGPEGERGGKRKREKKILVWPERKYEPARSARMESHTLQLKSS